MKPKNKHIVLLTPGFPESETDTTCIPALQLYVKTLASSQDFEITVVSFHYPYQKAIYLWNNIPVYSLGGANSLNKLRLWSRAYSTLKKINQKKQIDILHSFWLGECTLVANWFTKNKHPFKHITTLMGQDALPGNRYAKMLSLKKTTIISLSAFHKQIFQKNYAIDSTIIPWGIHVSDLPTHKNIDVIGVGNLNPQKNFNLFVEVIYELNKLKPLKAVLIGNGAEKEKIQSRISSLGLENTICFKGEIPYEETQKLIAQSKILLHPSNYESFGMVFAEALENQTMIVSKPTGCYFESENWLTAQTKNEMVEKCEKLLTVNFSTFTTNPYSISKTVEEYRRLYD